MPTRGFGRPNHNSTGRSLQDSRGYEDDDFPPLPSDNTRLPPLRSVPFWARRSRSFDLRTGSSSISTAVSRLRRRVADRLASLRNSESGPNPPNPRTQPNQSTQQTQPEEASSRRRHIRSHPLVDWDLQQAEYEELLRDLHISDPGRFTPSTFSTLRFLEQHPAMPLSSNNDLDRRRRSLPGAAATRSRHRSTAGPGGDGDDDHPGLVDLSSLDSGRGVWERLSHNTSSPFSLNMSSGQGPQPQDVSDDNYRAKRRKIDSDRGGAVSFKSPLYGRYGQVEPGDLTMEIVSCDGGLFSNGSSYTYENILKNDKSVYCTKSSRCNIVLRHKGGTCFSLQELIVKAPGSGNYSSPYVTKKHEQKALINLCQLVSLTLFFFFFLFAPY